MTKISKKALQLFIDVKQLEARIDEVEALRPHLSSSVFKSRKEKLEKRLKDLKKGKESESEELVLHIVVTE